MFDALRTGLEDAWASIAAFTPKLISALLILVVGAFIAKVVRDLATRLMTRFGIDANLDRVLVKAGLPAGRVKPTTLVAGLLYWLVMLITLQGVGQTLGATQLTNSLATVIGYLPLVVVAAAILVGTLMLADWVGDLVRDTAGENGRVASLAARIAIVFFGGFLALGQLKVAPAIVNGLFYAVLAVAAVSAIIAFGVGGIPVAREMLEDQAAKRRGGRPVRVPDAITTPGQHATT